MRIKYISCTVDQDSPTRLEISFYDLDTYKIHDEVEYHRDSTSAQNRCHLINSQIKQEIEQKIAQSD
jgi:hypothetical protein